MLAPLLLVFVIAAQREPVPVRAPLSEALSCLRAGPEGSTGFDESLERLPELLDSPAREFVEGAAFVAGEHQRAECAPALLDALRRDRLGRYGKQSRVGELALDALIRLRVAVPHERLFERGATAQPGLLFAAVMLDEEPGQRCDGLAKLLERTTELDTAHWAAAIELTRARDARVAQVLLRQQWRACVVVVGPSGASQFSERWSCRTRCGQGEVWPPYVGYSIELHDAEHALASPRIVRSTRSRAYSAPFSAVSQHLRDTWRLRLLAELAPREAPLSVADLSLTTRDCEALTLRSLAERHRDRIRAHVASLAIELRSSGLLPRSAHVERSVRVVVELRDCRPDRSVALELPQGLDGVRVVLAR